MTTQNMMTIPRENMMTTPSKWPSHDGHCDGNPTITSHWCSLC